MLRKVIQGWEVCVCEVALIRRAFSKLVQPRSDQDGGIGRRQGCECRIDEPDSLLRLARARSAQKHEREQKRKAGTDHSPKIRERDRPC